MEMEMPYLIEMLQEQADKFVSIMINCKQLISDWN